MIPIDLTLHFGHCDVNLMMELLTILIPGNKIEGKKSINFLMRNNTNQNYKQHTNNFVHTRRYNSSVCLAFGTPHTIASSYFHWSLACIAHTHCSFPNRILIRHLSADSTGLGTALWPVASTNSVRYSFSPTFCLPHSMLPSLIQLVSMFSMCFVVIFSIE